MNHPSLPPTTHTLEMAQVAELNERLASHEGAAAVTAAAIGVGGATVHHHRSTSLPEGEVLVRVSWSGSPEFPDIYGHFGQGSGPLEVLLHTAALDRLGRLLGLRQRWGVGLPWPRRD